MVCPKCEISRAVTVGQKNFLWGESCVYSPKFGFVFRDVSRRRHCPLKSLTYNSCSFMDFIVQKENFFKASHESEELVYSPLVAFLSSLVFRHEFKIPLCLTSQKTCRNKAAEKCHVNVRRTCYAWHHGRPFNSYENLLCIDQ